LIEHLPRSCVLESHKVRIVYLIETCLESNVDCDMSLFYIVHSV